MTMHAEGECPNQGIIPYLVRNICHWRCSCIIHTLVMCTCVDEMSQNDKLSSNLAVEEWGGMEKQMAPYQEDIVGQLTIYAGHKRKSSSILIIYSPQSDHNKIYLCQNSMRLSFYHYLRLMH